MFSENHLFKIEKPLFLFHQMTSLYSINLGIKVILIGASL